MPETCETLLGLVNSCIYDACHSQNREIYQVLPFSMDFKPPGELLNPMGKTVLSKCSVILNIGPVNIGNGLNARK